MTVCAWLVQNPVSAQDATPARFCIVIASYNNEKYAEGNLQSVIKQTYPYWRAIYINDCSSDKTKEVVDTFIQKHQLQDRFTIIHNTERMRALYNQYVACMMAEPDEIIVQLDGDDKFLHERVLDKLAEVYQDPEVWLAYAGYISEPAGYPNHCKPIPHWVAAKNYFRRWAHACVGLRSFYAGLFHQIKKEDLMYKGTFFPICYDRAIMFPLLEMSSRGHFRYIPEPLYIYNVGSPLTWFNRSSKEKKLDKKIRRYVKALPCYQPLDKAPWKIETQ